MKRILIMVLALALSVIVVGADDEGEHGPPPPTDPRFDFLRQLEGKWIGEAGSEGGHAGAFEFRVTAGGHAVEEREFAGTPMEMLTVYHMEGKDLVGTHYCMLGNQPRVVAARKVVDGTLTFACAGTPGNAASHDEEHVHGWSMRLDADGRLHYSAELVRDGQVTEAPTVVLTRSVDTAAR